MRNYRFLFAIFAILISLGILSSSPATAQLLRKVDGNPVAPEFALPNLDGEIKKLSDFRGQVVIVNFWATWCPPCRKEIPSMQRAWNILKDKNVMMLAIHVGGTEDKIWTFLTDYNVEFPVLIDKSSRVSRDWPMLGLPVTFIIDPKGKIALRAIGGREWDDEKLLTQVLALRE